MKQLRSESEKDKAVSLQKIEFLNLQLKEMETQLLDTKRSHESIIKALDLNSATVPSNSGKSLEQLKESHKRELKLVEQEFEGQKKRLLQQIENLTEKILEMEGRETQRGSEIQEKLREMQEALANSEEMKGKMSEQFRNLEAMRNKSMKDLEERYFSLKISLLIF